MDKYRQQHALRMHSNGTTAWETFLVVFLSNGFEFIAIICLSFCTSFIDLTKKWQFLAEFCMIILPTILAIPFVEHIVKLYLFCCLVIVCIVLVVRQKPHLKTSTCKTKSNNKHFITNYRATINFCSVLSILAVDFRVFPRQLAKTETVGYSIMDLGVAMYMLSNALVAPEINGRYDNVKKSLKNVVPLTVIGIVRFFVVKQTDYAVPVSEYGTHWNFFLTLAVVKVFSSLLLNIVKINYIWINASVLMIAHETLLQCGLQNFVLVNRKRDNFLTANREGLVSLLGYVSFYLFGVYFGFLIRNFKANLKRLRSCSLIFGVSLSFLVLHLILRNFFVVSRRLANSAFCTWALFITSFLVGVFYVQEVIVTLIFKGKSPRIIQSPCLYEAINYNGLVFFLVANLLTGLVNFTMYTWFVGDFQALIILAIYLLVNCVFVVVMQQKQLKLKL